MFERGDERPSDVRKAKEEAVKTITSIVGDQSLSKVLQKIFTTIVERRDGDNDAEAEELFNYFPVVFHEIFADRQAAQALARTHIR